MKNKHIGGDFSDFLKEDGIFEEVTESAIKKTIAFQLQQEMKAQKISKIKMARLMNTSRSTIDRLLNPDNDSLTLATLASATRVLGKRLNILIS